MHESRTNDSVRVKGNKSASKNEHMGGNKEREIEKFDYIKVS